MRNILHSLSVLGLAISLVSVSQGQTTDEFSKGTGALFVMSNDASRNAVISYRRAEDGSLQSPRRFFTGGRGSGGNNDPLGSQGSLTLNEDHTLLFAVNAGSSEVSVFQVLGTDLILLDKQPSGGSEPGAIAQHGRVVYVLNAGGSSNVAGFRVTADGKLRKIDNSLNFLSTNTSGASSLAFSPDGQTLVVTERITNAIDVFAVQGNGKLSPLVVNPGVGPGTFSVTFAPNGAALVSETGPSGGQNASAISSFAISAGGSISPISTSIPTLGAANCWNAVTPNGKWVYASNAGSSTISGFSIGLDGSLSPLPGTVVGTNPTGATNLDIAISADGKYLYSLDSKIGMISIFGIQADGTLSNLGTVGDLPQNVGFNGIAAI